MVRGGEETTRWPPSTEDALFRIAQEALTNVARHAQATQTVVSVETTGDRLHLVIADDGIGFDPAQVNVVAAGQGWGLISMTERAEAIGGLCRIESSPQRGTQVIVEVSR
jgi:signal transduction histidine kinase